MIISWQIPRNCLAWILLSQLMLIAPHVQRLPWWVLAVYGLCAIWRIMIYQGRWSFPGKGIKLLFALLCFFGIFQSYGSMIGLEPTVALLFSGFCLKLLEVTAKRDVYIIIFLAYFVNVTALLFSQDFSISLVVFASLISITAALIALHQPGYDRFTTHSLKKSLQLFAQALPLMLVLFVVFPRFEPLWNVPIPSHQAKSGVSDRMSPGDISDLTQSDALAFRAVFDGEVPSREQLYWRGLVLSKFDGRVWEQGVWDQNFVSLLDKNRVKKSLHQPIAYSIIQEASYQPWLFTLALAYSDDTAIRIASDFRLFHSTDIHSRIRYQVISDQQAVMQPAINSRIRRNETRLPDKSNPRARAYALSLYSQSTDELDFINRLLSTFRQEGFSYTLKPPLLGTDAVDDFLFQTRSGFCSHYASSFVFLMRAAAIPARVVVGYQGGEINPITGSVLVHQFDAHSWAEVWLPGRGWVRVDPTAAVSPDRIEFGLEQALAQEGSFLSESLLSPMKYRNIAWLNKLRLQMDAFDYYWASWVLQYKGDRQFDFLQKLLGEVSPLRVAALLLVCAALVLAIVALSLLLGRSSKTTIEVRLYLRLCKRLERAGFVRMQHEGAIDFACRVAELEPQCKQHLLAATRAFISLNYEPLSAEQRQGMLKILRAEVFKISYKIRLSPASYKSI